VPDKTERILTLTATLLDATGALTAEEIRERMAAYYTGGDASFHRAFERDKDELRSMGIPVNVERITHRDPPVDGYRIRRQDYALRDPGLEPDELAAINVALTAIEIEGAPTAETLWKLGGVVEGGAGPLTSLPVDDRLPALFEAVVERSTVWFTYAGEARTVDPHLLEFHHGHWYLFGHDHQRAAPRRFRLDRLGGELTVGEPGAFDRPASDQRSDVGRPWTFGEEEPVTARLRVDGPQATMAERHLGGRCVVSRDDEGAVFEVEVRHRPGFRSFVLGMLDQAEVLSPPELRAEMRDWLAAIAAGSGA